MIVNVFNFPMWTYIFMRETNTGFFQGCLGFDLLRETGIKKPPGIVLVSEKLGYVDMYCFLSKKHSGDHCSVTVVYSNNIGKNQTNWNQDL